MAVRYESSAERWFLALRPGYGPGAGALAHAQRDLHGSRSQDDDRGEPVGADSCPP